MKDNKQPSDPLPENDTQPEGKLAHAIWVTFFILVMVGLAIMCPVFIWAAFSMDTSGIGPVVLLLLFGLASGRFSYRIYKKLKEGRISN